MVRIMKTLAFLHIVLLSIYGQTVSSRADFQSIVGQWRGERIILAKDIVLDSSAVIKADIKMTGNNAHVLFQIDHDNSQKWDLVYSDKLHFYINQQSGLMAFFKRDKTPKLLSGDVVFWARNIDNGIVHYRASLAKTGALDFIRLALTREDNRLHVRFSHRQSGQTKQFLEAVLEPQQ